jgi:hypothetical protein
MMNTIGTYQINLSASSRSRRRAGAINFRDRMRLAVLDLAGALESVKRVEVGDVTKFWRSDVDLARQKGFLKY